MDCILTIYWQEGVRTSKHCVAEGKNEDEDVMVLRWADGNVETYSEELGPKIREYLLNKIIRATPVFHHLLNKE